ncbi:SphA family protein [Cupriavidus ulmosensis]|uniref:SphA family protein n=1 Tax=Cupriavidus ulmosensis TaxID=3065913 RepID=UPI00296AA19B|nr:transporter [Cupriavidus sp. CV2]MDW3683724.1 transporter [Cupriavidus sp. CV2]
MMMPEGANWLLFYQHYNATHFKDNGGHDNPKLAEFHLGSNALAPRLSYVWPGVRVFGANVETRVVQPILSVDLDMRVARPAPLPPLDRGGNKSGLADVSFSPVILGWHWPSFHHMFGLETHLKTGAYSVNDPVNIGRNYYQFAPNYAFTWFPAPDFDVSAKFRYGFNTRNTATNYQSGDEASIEFSSGYRASSHLSLGVNGYFYLQTTDDIQNGVRVNGNGNRGRVTALGPYVSYQVSPSLSFAVKAQFEFAARNRPQGTRIWALARMHF